MEKRPVLVTLTSPTAAGKSYLFNYIRDVARMPCLISTTTRAPRAGEKEGIDYYFIDEATSKRIEERSEFAELAIYRGVRYGVTKKEFLSKLGQGLAFLIVEPSGIDHYVQPALDAGALHLKYYIHTDPEVRLARFKERVKEDIEMALMRVGGDRAAVTSVVMPHMDRLVAMTTVEMQWGTMHHWDRTLFGEKDPAYNLNIILKDVEKAQARANACELQLNQS